MAQPSPKLPRRRRRRRDRLRLSSDRARTTPPPLHRPGPRRDDQGRAFSVGWEEQGPIRFGANLIPGARLLQRAAAGSDSGCLPRNAGGA